MLLLERSKFGLNELLGRTYLAMTPQLRRLAHAAPREPDLRRDELPPAHSHDATELDYGTTKRRHVQLHRKTAKVRRTSRPKKIIHLAGNNTQHHN